MSGATRARSLAGYATYRTTAPVLVRLARTQATAHAGFLALILAGGFAVDRLAGVLIFIVESFSK